MRLIDVEQVGDAGVYENGRPVAAPWRVRLASPGTGVQSVVSLPAAQRYASATEPGLVGGPARRLCFGVIELRDPDTGRVLAAQGGPWSPNRNRYASRMAEASRALADLVASGAVDVVEGEPNG